MIRRWILYLAAMLGCIGIYWMYQEWLGWMLLLAVLCTPVLGLLVSLPAMLKMRIAVSCPDVVTMGSQERIGIEIRCPMPTPPFRVKLVANRILTGEIWHLNDGDLLPTQHCGQLVCRVEKAVVYDYMGLFCLHIMGKREYNMLVRPIEVEAQKPQSLERYLAVSWRPKPGGGFAENHELREYRPGDSLNQIHWKMTAKTGKVIVREPMVPTGSLLMVTMELSGAPEEMDRKFGQCLWIGKYLLEQSIGFQLRALTANGIENWDITNQQELIYAQDQLLATAPAAENASLGRQTDAAWQYHVGGDADEA